MLIEPDALPSLREHQLQRRLATLKRVAPQIVAIQFDQVEGVEEYPFIMVAIANEIE